MGGVTINSHNNRLRKKADMAARKRDARIEHITNAKLRNMQRQTNLDYQKERDTVRDRALQRRHENRLSLRKNRFMSSEAEKERDWKDDNTLNERMYNEKRDALTRKQRLWEKSQDRENTLADESRKREWDREDEREKQEYERSKSLTRFKMDSALAGAKGYEGARIVGSNIEIGKNFQAPKKGRKQVIHYTDPDSQKTVFKLFDEDTAKLTDMR